MLYEDTALHAVVRYNLTVERFRTYELGDNNGELFEFPACCDGWTLIDLDWCKPVAVYEKDGKTEVIRYIVERDVIREASREMVEYYTSLDLSDYDRFLLKMCVDSITNSAQRQCWAAVDRKWRNEVRDRRSFDRMTMDDEDYRYAWEDFDIEDPSYAI